MRESCGVKFLVGRNDRVLPPLLWSLRSLDIGWSRARTLAFLRFRRLTRKLDRNGSVAAWIPLLRAGDGRGCRRARTVRECVVVQIRIAKTTFRCGQTHSFSAERATFVVVGGKPVSAMRARDRVIVDAFCTIWALKQTRHIFLQCDHNARVVQWQSGDDFPQLATLFC